MTAGPAAKRQVLAEKSKTVRAPGLPGFARLDALDRPTAPQVQIGSLLAMFLVPDGGRLPLRDGHIRGTFSRVAQAIGGVSEV